MKKKNMSGQLIELIIFAAIAFAVISKLISTLGTTSEEDKSRKSFFGESGGLKDVTESDIKAKDAKIVRPIFNNKNKIDLTNIVTKENEKAVKQGITEVMDRLSSFDIHKFVKGAKTAFEMILEAADNNDEALLEELVDKRYMTRFKELASSYGGSKPASDLKVMISEVYMFGNNIFIKVMFSGKRITDKLSKLHEEWTFTRSIISAGPAWHLTNIDRLQ